MASGSFKTPCPSCEALVLVKDASIIGKKIDCPKCKYRFVVEDPKKAAAKSGKAAAGDDEVVDDLEEIEEEQPKKEAPARKAATVATKAKADAKEAAPTKAKANGKPADKAKPGDKKPADDDGDEKDRKKKKGKKGGSNKMVLGLVLAGVGVAVLGVAGFLVLGGKGGAAKTAGPTTPPAGQGAQAAAGNRAEAANPGNPGGDSAADPTIQAKKPKAAAVIPVSLSGPGPELTNLLPGKSQHVFHLFFKNALDTFLAEAAFQPGVFDDQEFKKRLGFSVTKIDDLLRAENYTYNWTFTVVHLKEAVNDKALTEALGLQPGAGSPINRKPFFKVTKNNAWLEQLARLSLGTTPPPRTPPAKGQDRPLLVRIHDVQTLIFVDAAPMQEFLALGAQAVRPSTPAPAKGGGADGDAAPPRKKGRPDVQSLQTPSTGRAEGSSGPPSTGRAEGSSGPPSTGRSGGISITTTAPGAMSTGRSGRPASESQPPASPGGEAAPGGASYGEVETYTTLKPALKAMLDKMETTQPESRDRVLFSAATEMDAARVDSVRPDGRLEWRFRETWDVAHALTENPQRLRILGAALILRGRSDPITYVYQNEIDCASSSDARSLKKDLQEKVAPDLARFFERLLGLKVELPPDDSDPSADTLPPGGFPGGERPSRPSFSAPGGLRPGAGPGPDPANQPKVESDKSRIAISQVENNLVFTLDLVMNHKSALLLTSTTELVMYSLKGELELAAGTPHRHDLAYAVKRLGEQGIPDKGVPPGRYPPGVFERTKAKARAARDPSQRVGWMAGLLPMLGQETLYLKIKYDNSWKDPSNWMAARNLVPEFLDPTYPDWARFTPYPGIPFPLGGTHFVGLAGIGQDAADYPDNDPAVVTKLGVIGYNRMTSLEEIQKNHGLSNTAVVIQVPFDGPAGVTPWMAGGGSTVRGVPEKNSVKPFVATTYNGKRGTYLLMADSTVRFVSEDIKDEVFKALVTVKGPMPDFFDIDRDAPAIKGPKGTAAPTVAKTGPAVKPTQEPKASAAPKAATNAPTGWQEFVSKEGGYAVLLPGAPRSGQEKLPPQLGGVVMKKTNALLPEQKRDFGVAYFDWPREAMSFPRDQRFAMVKEMVTGVAKNIVVKDEKDITVGEQQVKELLLEAPGMGAAVFRVYLVDPRCYVLLAAGPAVASADADTQMFFGSFKLLAGAK
jgi:hypothetical protein